MDDLQTLKAKAIAANGQAENCLSDGNLDAARVWVDLAANYIAAANLDSVGFRARLRSGNG